MIHFLVPPAVADMLRPTLVLVLLLLPGSEAPLLDYCDPHLRSRKEDYFGYRARRDRCEGRYIADQAGTTTLNVVSFTSHPVDFDSRSQPDVRVQWPAYSADSVALRVSSVRSSEYYRMDTRQRTDSRAFAWPTTVLRGLNLRGSDLGLLARTLPRRGRGTTVLLPVEVVGLRSPAATPSYRLTVIPGRRLTELYMTVSAESGHPMSGTRTALRQYPYAPGRRIPIMLPEDLASGQYRVELEAEHQGGGSTVEFMVLIP